VADRRRPEPGDAEWRALYASTQAFREAAPWTELSNEDVFAVEVAGAGEATYCVVMGAGGVEYGLGAYPGTRGLAGYALMMDPEADQDEVLLNQDALLFMLADRQALDDRDRAVHARLGMRFRGKGAWPLFRRHRPNLLPAHLGPGEAQLLATCLDQASALTAELGAGATSLDLGPQRVPLRRRDGEGNWHTDVAVLPAPRIQITYNAACLQRIQANLKPERMEWEVRIMALARIAGEKGEPDSWGRVLLCVDRESGFIFFAGVMGPAESVTDGFLGVIEQTGFYPSGIRLTSALLDQQLAPVTGPLGIAKKRVKRLPRLDEAAAALGGRFG